MATKKKNNEKCLCFFLKKKNFCKTQDEGAWVCFVVLYYNATHAHLVVRPNLSPEFFVCASKFCSSSVCSAFVEFVVCVPLCSDEGEAFKSSSAFCIILFLCVLTIRTCSLCYCWTKQKFEKLTVQLCLRLLLVFASVKNAKRKEVLGKNCKISRTRPKKNSVKIFLSFLTLRQTSTTEAVVGPPFKLLM